jgi:hypothetical protein
MCQPVNGFTPQDVEDSSEDAFTIPKRVTPDSGYPVWLFPDG